MTIKITEVLKNKNPRTLLSQLEQHLQLYHNFLYENKI